MNKIGFKIGTILVTMILLFSIPTASTAAIHSHSRTHYKNSTCLICRDVDIEITYGCSGNPKEQENAKRCSIDPVNCQYRRTLYYTCWKCENGCHSDRVTYNVHAIKHFESSHNSGCVY